MFALTLEDYEITENGEVINKRNGHILKPQKNGKGYYRVSIGGKLMFVHRLVAQKYIPNPKNLPQVNHIDGNKNNNNVKNLEWVSNKTNREHALKNGLHRQGENDVHSKLTLKEVIEIREIGKSVPRKELAEKYNISRQAINDILHYRTWKNS